MTTCSICANPMPEVARFCPRCGAAVGPDGRVAVRLPRRAGTVTVTRTHIDLGGNGTIPVSAVAAVGVETRRNFSPSDSLGNIAAGAALVFAGLWATHDFGCLGVLMFVVGAFVGLKGVVAGLAARDGFALVVTTADGRRRELTGKKRKPLDRAAAAIGRAMARQ